MAPEKKRQRPTAKGGNGPKKRQKIDAPKKNASHVKKRPVVLDALPWNEVEMPEMFDDAEGFFGLEEIDGVDILRNGNTITFVSANAKEEESHDDLFEGFGDEEREVDGLAKTTRIDKVEPAQATADSKKKAKKEKQKEKKNESPKENKTPKSSIADLEFNGFDILSKAAELEEEGADVSAWADLDLSRNATSALSKLGFTTPTAIQSEAIPEILAGHDVIGKASTGSGKTLAFGIPIMESWLDLYKNLDDEELKIPRPPTALILSPTRELAHQITDHIRNLCAGLPNSPFIAAVTGGLSVHKQQRQLARADVIIGTPGRLWEVISSSIQLLESLRKMKFLVVDEADRLLTEGHFKEVEEILGALDRQQDAEEDADPVVPTRQTLVFSATLHKDLMQKLGGKGKRGLAAGTEPMEYLLNKLNFREEKPKFVDVNPTSQMAEGLKEGMVECAGTEKDLYLYALLLYHPKQRALIFTNSIHSVRRLTPLLQNLGLPAQALHSQMAQKARMRSMERFSAVTATGSILVATDVAARGLDISGVQVVIHYHLPRSADMYVHRSGRTARAAATGLSILLCAPEEIVGTRRLVAKVHAHNAVADGGSKSQYYMQTLDVDRRIVARIKPRVTLAKKIADSALAKEKKSHDDDWVKAAAEELGVEYDSEEMEASGQRTGRGTGRKKKEKEARAMSKNEVGALRGELKALLSQRVNVGVSERYLTSSTVDINELLKGTQGEFLGKVDSIVMDE